MQALAISYFKRYKMEIGLADLPSPSFPAGFQPVAWRPDLLDSHATVLHRSFAAEIDSQIFPSLGDADGSRRLMADVARHRSFIPEATWLLLGPDGPCGSIQALRERPGIGAIQNIGILPPCRGRGAGHALLLQSLQGMYAAGMGRAILEVTAHNEIAIGMYARLGFRRTKVVYKAVPALPYVEGASSSEILF